jgi:hypothetical protein
MNINLGISLAGLNDVFIHKETTPSAAVTGTLTETQVYALTIPANSFSAGDKFVLDGLIADKIGTAGSATIRVKLSTSSTMPAGTTDRIAEVIMSSSNLYIGIARLYNLIAGAIRGINFSTNSPSYTIVASGGNTSSKAFDPTVTNYLYISVILGSIADSVTVHGYTLKNF